HSAVKILVFRDTGGAGLTLGGSAATVVPSAAGLSLVTTSPPPAVNSVRAWPNNGNTFDLSRIAGVQQQLTINDGAAKPTLTFNQADNDLRAITSEELQTLIQNHFNANGVNATCDIMYVAPSGSPSAIAYSTAEPDTAWVGSTDGTLYKTTD